MKFFEATDPCWLRLDRLGALGRLTFSLLRGTDPAHPIVATLAQDIAALVDLHHGALLTDSLNGADVILATQTTVAGLPVRVAEARAELIAFGRQACDQLTDEGFVVARHDGANLLANRTTFSPR